MRRNQVILLAIALAFLGTLMPIGAALQLSWEMAIADRRQVLQGYGERLLQRSMLTVAGAVDPMRIMAGVRREPCSPEHIAAMHQLTINSQFIDEIGYLRDGLLHCTTWGTTLKKIQAPQPVKVSVNDA